MREDLGSARPAGERPPPSRKPSSSRSRAPGRRRRVRWLGRSRLAARPSIDRDLSGIARPFPPSRRPRRRPQMDASPAESSHCSASSTCVARLSVTGKRCRLRASERLSGAGGLVRGSARPSLSTCWKASSSLQACSIFGCVATSGLIRAPTAAPRLDEIGDMPLERQQSCCA